MDILSFSCLSIWSDCCGQAFCKFSGFGVPFDCFLQIFLYAFAVVIAIAQIVLCGGMPLFSGFCVPLDSFLHILCYTKSVVIANAQNVLCNDISLFLGLCAESKRRPPACQTEYLNEAKIKMQFQIYLHYII